MKRLILAMLLVAGPVALLLVHPLHQQTAFDRLQLALQTQYSGGQIPDCKDWDRPGHCNVAIGLHAGADLDLTEAAGNILLGSDTRAPSPRAHGFVNIGNHMCFWRQSGEQVPCPKPYIDPKDTI